MSREWTLRGASHGREGRQDPILVEGPPLGLGEEVRVREVCPNPFCDGPGNIDVSEKVTGRSRTYGTCEVGPHREFTLAGGKRLTVKAGPPLDLGESVAVREIEEAGDG